MPIRSGSRSKTGKLFRYPSGHRCRVVLAADPRGDPGPIPCASQDGFRRQFLTGKCGDSGSGTTVDFVNNQDLPVGMPPGDVGATPTGPGTYPATSYVNTQLLGSMFSDWTQWM
jgi:hypothetical protein